MLIRNRFYLILFLLFPMIDMAADHYVISLDGLQVTTKLTGYYIEKVINATVEDSCIGFVQTGMFNRQEAAYLSPSTTIAIEECLKRSFPRTGSAKPLIIRINKLFVYERTWSSKEIAAIELSVSFITKDEHGLFDQFTAGEYYQRNGLDVTGFHKDNIVEAFGVCFDDFDRIRERGLLKPRKITEAELTRNPLDHPEDFPVFQKNRVSRGLFRTFYSFRDCRPDTLTSFGIEYAIRKKDSTRMRASLKLPPELQKKKIYGFSDGQNLFMWAGSGFALVKKKEKSMSVRVEKSDLDDQGSSDVYMAGFMFGAIGGLLATLATLATDPDQDGVSAEGRCNIDFVCGRLVPKKVPDYLRIESNTVLFLSMATAYQEPVSVICEHDTLCILQPGNCLKLVLSSKYREVTLHLSAKGTETLDRKITPRLFNTDVYIVRAKRNGRIMMETAFDQIKKDILDNTPPEKIITRRDISPQ
jgi:hypothetical protein